MFTAGRYTPIRDGQSPSSGIFSSRSESAQSLNEYAATSNMHLNLAASSSRGQLQIDARTLSARERIEIEVSRHNVEQKSLVTQLNTKMINWCNKQALYDFLPFISISGMSFRESMFRSKISAISPTSAINQDHESEKTAKSDMTFTLPFMNAIWICCALQFLVGFNLSNPWRSGESHLFTADEGDPQTYLPHLPASMAVAAYAIGGPFGCLFGTILSNSKGRRGALLVSMWVFTLGGIVGGLATSGLWVIFSRLTLGVAAGMVICVNPVYLGELAPPTSRGYLGNVLQYAFAIGILASDLATVMLRGLETSQASDGQANSDIDEWRFLIAVNAVVSLCLLYSSSRLMESPRWLLAMNSLSIRARDALYSLRNLERPEVEVECEHYMRSAGWHEVFRAGMGVDYFCEQFSSASLPLSLSVVLLYCLQGLSGFTAVLCYSTVFINAAPHSPLFVDERGLAACISLAYLLSTPISLALLDHFSRRAMLIFSILGMLGSILYAISSSYQAPVIGVTSMVFFYGIGLGPVPALFIGEIFDPRYVIAAMQLGHFVYWCCMCTVMLAFPFLLEPDLLGWRACFYPSITALGMGLLWVLFCLRESRVCEDEISLGENLSSIHADHPMHHCDMKEIQVLHSIELMDIRRDHESDPPEGGSRKWSMESYEDNSHT